MNERIKKILEFIFPEYQIIKSINKYGFIAKKNKSVETQTAPSNISVKRDNAMQMAAQSNSVTSPKYNNKSTSTTASYSGKTDIKISGNQLDSKITTVRKNVLSNIVGQAEAVENLMVALKRPLVTGFYKDMPRNTFFIIGRNSSGRHTLLINTVNAAKHEELLNYTKISRLNLALYPTSSEKVLFLSDIYKVLYICNRNQNSKYPHYCN
ncbi:MAG: hypothetical protein FWH53_00030 [Leptospirales bacterium]|nr:hypothetical protein [Leptospirales bacterium]